MAQTIEDVNSRTILQQFHELYNKQNETETDVQNIDAKIDQETNDRQIADLSINSEIQTLKDQIDSLGVLFTYKGEVATIQDLPATNNKLGDVYYVDSEQSGYVWLEKSGVYQWEEFGPAIDLSEYAKQEDLQQIKSEVDAMNTQVESNTSNIVSLTNSKQDKLTAGTNITIDENNVISASGGSGSKLYQHCIKLGNVIPFRQIIIITSSSTLFNDLSLYNWLTNNGFNNVERPFPIASIAVDTYSDSITKYVGIIGQYSGLSFVYERDKLTFTDGQLTGHTIIRKTAAYSPGVGSDTVTPL